MKMKPEWETQGTPCLLGSPLLFLGPQGTSKESWRFTETHLETTDTV